MLFKPFLFGLFLLQLARSFGRLSLFGGKKSRNKNCKADEFEKYNVPANSSAKCIDGSSPAFYFRQGKDNGVSKWFVYFEGGGWCYDMKACEIRSKIHYGSSLEYPRCEKVDKANIFLTSDQKKNPQFYNWNMVHVKYCDGSSYAGDRDVVHNGKTFFFRGKHNREQTILSLLSLGMKSAKEIVISGCSAGGLAIYLGLDQMVHQIKEVNPSASVRGVSFSGFFLDYSSTKPQVEGNKDDGVWNGYLDYANSMKNLYQWMNIRSGANPRCVSSQLQRHRNDTDCIFAYYLAAHIKTPIFNIQPKYDHWQAMHILGSKDNVAINSYGHTLQKQMIETFHHSALADKHGTFIDSCNHHCFGCSVAEEDTWNGPHVVSTGDKLTPAAALRRWYEASLEREKSLEEKTHQHRYFQDFPFPCESCCKCSW